MPRDVKPQDVEVSPEPQAVVTPAKPVLEAGKYRLMAFYLVYGKYMLYQVDNPKNVVAVAPADVEFTVGEQLLSADVLNKETTHAVHVPDSVANTLDAVRNIVLP